MQIICDKNSTKLKDKYKVSFKLNEKAKTKKKQKGLHCNPMEACMRACLIMQQ